ncbi:isochorismatase family protein [Streptosporangium sp. CA-115845]|uniref:isochorismatase family protein n=1 Tax=Streptosporangium sp. CA-115845 TaxID=3240071 RepID=UPI003D91B058
MAIAPIAPYAMPTSADLPANRLPWSPDGERTALLIHDMQRYFLDPFSPGHSPLVELVDNTHRLRGHCASLQIPIIYSAQPGGQNPAERGLLLELWGKGIGADPAHTDIIEPLTPRKGEIQLPKFRYSAFKRTHLTELLTALNRDQLIICGVYAHIGVLATAADAFQHDIQPIIALDAVADFSAADHRQALTSAAELYGVTFSTEQIIARLTPVRQDTLADTS